MSTLLSHSRTALLTFTLLLGSVLSDSLLANATYSVADILAMEQAPTGVVFEVVASETDYLQTALDQFATYREQLTTRFPGIQLAIVSHGSEQFALMTANQASHHGIHGLVKRISASNVPVTICGNHAKLRGVAASDFPDYVVVANRGPTAIKAYQDQGYLLVLL